MGIKYYKPTSPGRRGGSVLDRAELTRQKPEKSLLAPLKKTGGRNNHGTVTARHRGGGAKRRYRIIDFKRNKDGVPAKVAHIEYDPNRTAYIALLHYADGEKRYIIWPKGLKQGTTISSGENAEPKTGCAMELRHIPRGANHASNLSPRSCAPLHKGVAACANPGMLCEVSNVLHHRSPFLTGQRMRTALPHQPQDSLPVLRLP